MATEHNLPLRRRPDPRSPVPWPADTVARLQNLAKWLTYPLLPFYVLRWLLNPRGQKLRLYLATRMAVWNSHLVPLITPPETDHAAASLCAPGQLYAAFPKDVWDGAAWDVASIPPAPADMLGELTNGPACVKPVARPGFMITPNGAKGTKFDKARPGEKIILFIHGGGYIRGHPLWTPFPVKLAKDTGVRVFLCQYRKTLTDETAYPAPLMDAVAAWHYVTITLGFPPASIMLAGDSAGGHLSLALVQQLAALSRPQAGSLVLVSPWADFTCTFPSWANNESLDILSKKKLGNAIKSAVRHYGREALTDPLFSPALAPAGHWACLTGTPTYVSIGTDEVFADEDYALVSDMRRDGVDVTVFEDEHGLHEGPITMLSIPGTYERFTAGLIKLLKQMPPQDE